VVQPQRDLVKAADCRCSENGARVLPPHLGRRVLNHVGVSVQSADREWLIVLSGTFPSVSNL